VRQNLDAAFKVNMVVMGAVIRGLLFLVSYGNLKNLVDEKQPAVILRIKQSVSKCVKISPFPFFYFCGKVRKI
jgi:hypothetical protein